MSRHDVLKSTPGQEQMDQPVGTLLQTPLEIRHAIFAHLLPTQVHIHSDVNKIYMSVCLAPEEDERSTCCTYTTKHKKYDGYERVFHRCETVDERAANTEEIWARRLRSTWGPHWRCEQSAKDGLTMDLSLLMVCKKLCDEGLDFMSRTTVFNITNLNYLEHIPRRATDRSPTSSNYLSNILERGIIHLNITLRWPLKAYIALDHAIASEPEEKEGQTEEEEVSHVVKAWARTCELLSSLDKLANLRLWFDHSEPSTWTLVNEKALLNSLISQMCTTTANVVVILPKLHPLYEDEERHFMEENIGTRFHLYRMLRQRWHSSENDYGEVEVINKPDFPISIDVYYDMTVEEAEEWERQAWKEGINVEADVDSLRPENNHVPY